MANLEDGWQTVLPTKTSGIERLNGLMNFQTPLGKNSGFDSESGSTSDSDRFRFRLILYTSLG